MTKPVAYMWKTERGTIVGFEPNDDNHSGVHLALPLYTAEQLHPRVKMTQAEFDETVVFLDRSGDRAFGRLYEVLTVIKENPGDGRYYNLYRRLFGNADDVIDSEKQYEFATLFMLKNPEETIEIVPDMKWFVRRILPNAGGNMLYCNGEGELTYNYNKEYATQFDTKEEAELWTNPLTEAVQLPVEVE